MSTNPYRVGGDSRTAPAPCPRRPRKLLSAFVLILAIVEVWVTVSSDVMSEFLSKGFNIHRYHISLMILDICVTACLLTSAYLWWRGNSLSGTVTLCIAVLAFFGAPFMLFLVLFP